MVGHGTTFRLDTFGNCATAFHVFEDSFFLGGANGRELLVRKDRAIIALELEGVIFGVAPIRPHQWRPMHSVNSVVRIEERPFEAPRLRNLTELLSLCILPSSPKPEGVEFLHVDISTWRPTIGEVVLGMGYPNLDKDEGGSDDRPVSQYMYGAYGRITDIEPLDFNRGRPWPMVRVEADWDGGMSGGPVVNAAGNVIGVISTGVDTNLSTAMIFGGWSAVRHMFPSLDPARPGWFHCFATLDAHEHLLEIAANRHDAEEAAAGQIGAFVSKISLEHASGTFTRLEL